MKVRLTVIIPVYNTASTLDRCVESVLSQGCEGMEVILVDDGSSDGSGALCDQWAERDARIAVLHKPNGGLSDARNHGLNSAVGVYVTFVDSDDFIAPGTYAPLMALLDGHPSYDILEYSLWKRYGSPMQEMLRLEERQWHDTSQYWLQSRAYAHSYMCNKIFRRTLFSGIRFPVGVVFEDIHTLPRLLREAREVATTSRGAYCYCWNAAGITATAGARELRDLLEAHLRVIDDYRGMEGFGAYYLHVLDIQLSVCAIAGDPPQLSQACVSLGEARGVKAKAKAMANNILGIESLCKLYRLLFKTRNRH